MPRYQLTISKILKSQKLIDLAIEAGANAVKFQTFRPDSLTLKSNTEDSFWVMKVIGQDILYMSFMNKQQRHMNGMKNYLIMQIKKLDTVHICILNHRFRIS